MSKWQPIWLALCFAVAYAANRGLAPTVAYEMSVAARTMPTGVLKLAIAGRSQQLPVTTALLVADALRPLLSDEQPVRVLWLRGVEDGQGGEPDVELFVDLIGAGAAPDVGAADLAFLRDRDLTVLTRAPGSAARSRVRLPGDSASRLVRGGALYVKRVLTLPAGAEAARSRIEGTLQLLLERDSGDPEPVNGTFDARLAR